VFFGRPRDTRVRDWVDKATRAPASFILHRFAFILSEIGFSRNLCFGGCLVTVLSAFGVRLQSA
jgi:hypothetical protein